MIKLRLLRWRDYPGLSPWAHNVITRVLVRGRQEGQSQGRRCDDGSRGQSDFIAGWDHTPRSMDRL